MHLQEAQQRQAAEEAAKSGEEANDLEKAQDFGRLRTMQVMQARVTGKDTSKALPALGNSTCPAEGCQAH